MKRLLALLLALCLTLPLAACGEQAPVEPEPAPNSEIALAIEYGLVPEDLQNSYDKTVTSKEFCEMLGRVVAAYGEEFVPAWESAAETALKSKSKMTRETAILAVYEAVCAMGQGEFEHGDWQTVQAQVEEAGWDWRLTSNYPDWPNWRTASPLVGSMFVKYDEMNYMDAALRFSFGQRSLEDGRLVFDFDLSDVAGYLRGGLSRAEAMETILRFYESIPKRATEAEAAAVAAEADTLREAILTAPTDVGYTGTAYYVSSSEGSDRNDGRAPERAFRTLERLESAPIQTGDAVFFKRGDIWRGEMLFCGAGVTYSAYGEGAKPRFYGCKEDGVGAEKWNLYYEGPDGEKIWEFYRPMRETGAVVFNGGEQCVTRVYSWWVTGSGNMVYDDLSKPFTPEEGLSADLTMCCMIDYSGSDYPIRAHRENREGGLYVRCDAGNPGELFGEVEFQTTDTEADWWSGLIQIDGDGCVVDNLSVVYWGKGGIVTEVGRYRGITVQNCEVGWGGAVIHEYDTPAPWHDEMMLSGDGIYGVGPGGKVVGNYVHDVDACGVTIESSFDEEIGTLAGDLLARGNLVEYSGEGISLRDPNQSITFEGKFIVEDNMCLYIGEGYVHGSRGPHHGIEVSEGLSVRCAGVEIIGNTVYRAKANLLTVGPNATLADNTFLN